MIFCRSKNVWKIGDINRGPCWSLYLGVSGFSGELGCIVFELVGRCSSEILGIRRCKQVQNTTLNSQNYVAGLISGVFFLVRWLTGSRNEQLRAECSATCDGGTTFRIRSSAAVAVRFTAMDTCDANSLPSATAISFKMYV